MPHYKCPSCRILFSAKDDPALEKLISKAGGDTKSGTCPECGKQTLKYIEK